MTTPTDAPTRRLQTIAEKLRQLEAERAQTVAQARQHGVTWVEIGRALGVTKQAAQQRYGAK